MKKINRKFLKNLKYKKIEARRSDELAFEIIKRYYNRFGLKHLYKRHNNKILEIIRKSKTPKEKLLDIGCGFGDFLLDARQEVDYVYGVDLGKENITLAKENTAGYKNIKLILADGEHLPFENNFFDYIIMKGIVHHLGNPGRVFKEAKRVLKKEGLLIIFEGNPTSLYRKIILAVADLLRIKHETSLFPHLSPDEIKKLLIEEKFTVSVKKCQGFFAPIGLVGFGNRFIWDIFGWFEDFFEKKLPLFGWYALIICKK